MKDGCDYEVELSTVDDGDNFVVEDTVAFVNRLDAFEYANCALDTFSVQVYFRGERVERSEWLER